MAKITTYTAPIERIRPSDLGYTSQIQLGRRLSGFASETLGALRADTELKVSALKQGGALASQNIITQRRGVAELQRYLASLEAEATPAPSRGGGGGGGSGGGGSLGNNNGPREVARAAPALVRAVSPSAPAADAAPVQPHYITRDFPTPINRPGQSIVFGGQGLAVDPYGLNNKPAFDNGDPLGIQGNAAGEPQPPAGGNYQKYGYGTGPEPGAPVYGDTAFGPPAPAPPSVFQTWLDRISGADQQGGADYTQGTDY